MTPPPPSSAGGTSSADHLPGLISAQIRAPRRVNTQVNQLHAVRACEGVTSRVVAARSGVGRLGTQARAEHVAQLGDPGQKVSDRPVPAVTADVDRLQGGLLQVRVGDQVHDVGLAVLLGLAADVALQLVRLVYVEGHSRSAYRLRGGVWAKTTVSYSSHSHAV